MNIAVYTIACNEQDQVEGWMESVQDANEIVVAVVNSTDKTHIKLIEGGARTKAIWVQPFRFDIARNAVLSMVPNHVDVCVSLDMDERLVSGWRESLERAWGNFDNQAFCAIEHGDLTFDTGNRIHSRFGWHWRFPAHEGLYEYGIKKVTATVDVRPFIIHHQNLNKSRLQYLDLLRIGVDENPRNRRCIHYYARELYYRGRWSEALPWFDMYLKFPSFSHPVEEKENARMLLECQQHCGLV